MRDMMKGMFFSSLMSRLSLRIIFLSVVVFIIGIFSMTAVLTRNELASESRSLFDSGLLFAELTAPALYQSYLTATADGLLNFGSVLSERLSRNPNISSIAMVGTNGKVLFDSQDLSQGVSPGRTSTTEERYITEPESLAMFAQEQTSHRTFTTGAQQYTEIVVPIAETTGAHAFSMRYILSYKLLEERRQSIINSVVVLAIPLLIAATLLSISLALSITRPLRKMAVIAGHIGAGNYTDALRTDSPGELGLLANSLNTMSAQLKFSQAKDASYREELSLKVEQLEKAKQKLEASLDELTRFHRIAVDRELRMKELKTRNEELTRSVTTEPPANPPTGTNAPNNGQTST